MSKRISMLCSAAALSAVVLVVLGALGCAKQSTTSASAPTPSSAVPTTTQAASSDPAAASPMSANKVGTMVESEYGTRVGVAGGKVIDGTSLGVRVYLDLGELGMGSESPFTLRSTAGGLAQPDGSLPDSMPYLNPLESGLGWVSFTVNGLDGVTQADTWIWDNLTLAYKRSDAGVLTQIEIPLAGLGSLPADNAVTQEYAKATKAEAAEIDASSITMAEYKKVKNGMTLTQVNETVGFKGEEMSSSGSYKTYSWANDHNGSNMTVMFNNNRVISKAQAGL